MSRIKDYLDARLGDPSELEKQVNEDGEREKKPFKMSVGFGILCAAFLWALVVLVIVITNIF